jgi:CRP/FNR family cyclic AMP-dependent transcriptional regulator
MAKPRPSISRAKTRVSIRSTIAESATRAPRRPACEHITLLQRQPLFGELDQAQLERLVSYAKTTDVPAGTTIFSKGDPGTALFAIRSGTIKITVPSADGREAVFNLLQDGDIFGEIALLDGRPRTADAVTTTACNLLVIERRDFLTFVESNPKVALKIIELLCARLRWASEHFEEAVLENLPVRLARTLLRLVKGSEVSAKNPTIKITQHELSRVLGATRESVNRQLRAWEAHKWIEIDRGGIVVRSVDQLAMIGKQLSNHRSADR